MSTPLPDPAALRFLLPQLLDEAEAARIWERFCRPLLQVARRHLKTDVSARVAPEDVVQSVFRTLYRQAKEAADSPADAGRLPETMDEVEVVLRTLTVRRAINRRRNHLRACRSTWATTSAEGADWASLADTPTPTELTEQEAELARLRVRLVEGFELPHHRAIALRLLDGAAVADVATAAGCVPRTVYRVQAELREACRRLLAEDVGG